MNLELGKRVIRKTDMKEGTIVSVDDNVAKVVFDGGEIKYVHKTLLAEKLDGLNQDDRQFLQD
jgi:hypothetical protein